MFRVRLDLLQSNDDATLVKIISEVIFREALELVSVKHVLPHGNPHYHAYAKTDQKEPTIRQRIKRLGFSASDFSLKKCDETRKDEYIQYLFNQKHGNLATIADVRNISSEYLSQLQAQAELVALQFKNDHPAKRISKPTVSDYATEIKETFIEQYRPSEIRYNYDVPHGALLYKAYLEIAIRICNKYNQPFEEHYLRRLVATAMCKTESGKAVIISKIMDKEFPE